MRTIGKLGKPFRLDGELNFQPDPRYLDALEHLDVVFLEIKGAPAPFFIEGISDNLIKFEDVDTREAAAALAGLTVNVRPEDLPASGETDTHTPFLPESWIGYFLHDRDTGPVGPIEEILEMPQQIMAVVTRGAKELLIPLHPDLICSVDDRGKKLEMDLPEGLLDL